MSMKELSSTQRLAAVDFESPEAAPVAPVVPWRKGEYVRESLQCTQGRKFYSTEAVTRVDLPVFTG
jgi:hypothetical protein